MKLSGHGYDELDWTDVEVDEAVVTPTRLVLDWTDDGDKFHLRAESTDKGLTYVGTWGDPTPYPDWRIELTRYVAIDGSIMLWAEWEQLDIGQEGSSVFFLAPDSYWDAERE